MEHGWRGRSCNQALRREEGPHLTLCNQALRWKEALVLGGQAIAADVSQGVSVNAIDENLYQILWIGARMPHLLRWELGEYIKYKHLDPSLIPPSVHHHNHHMQQIIEFKLLNV